MKDKSKTLGWNPTYFGEPKKGSLAAVIADVTEKQNAVVGEKPEVQSSAAVQAKEAQSKQEAMNPAQQAAIAIDMKKKGKKPKNEDDAEDMRDKNKKDAKGETGAIKVHGEDLNAEIEKAKASKVKSLVDTIKDMFYNIPEAKHHDDEDKEKEEGNAFTKALMAAKEKGEKTFTVAGKHYDVKKEEDKLDKVNPVAVKKKFKDRKDQDIDNDGDVDDSDKFLHKRRKAISKAVAK
jgi:hypothetical protein|tara:strand:+ start:1284 stop:1988 length:705 start_codon:yes stop_codon:yes gene_type:complete